MKQLQFKKYSSIENSYRQKYLDVLTEQGHSGGEWIVQEKIHGANFSIWYDGFNFKTAKRSSFLDQDEKNFYGSHLITGKLKKQIIELYNDLVRDVDVFTGIVVYGEIFGGSYSHPLVEKIQGVSRVQKGVEYIPDISFYAYDIALVNEDTKTFLNMDIVEELLSKAGFFYARTLFRGSLEECLKYPNEFQTTIPQLLGLPPIEDNICEGVVIKPIEEKYTWNGARVLLKNKNDKFSEKEKGPAKVKQEVVFSEVGQKMYEEMSSLVTINRLKNVLSKIGDITDRDFGIVMRDMNLDVIEDFRKDFGEEFDALEKEERKNIQKKVGQQNAKLIRKNFLNIIDKVF